MKNRGFTLIEIVVVLSIIILLSSLVLANYRTGANQLALERSVHKLTQDLRRTQEKAMSAKEFQGQVPPRYGIELNTGSSDYVLFADINNNGKYESPSPDIEVERMTLEQGVTIDGLFTPAPKTTIWVSFGSPDPSTQIRDPDECSSLTVQLKGANNQIKTLLVNNAGLIASE